MVKKIFKRIYSYNVTCVKYKNAKISFRAYIGENTVLDEYVTIYPKVSIANSKVGKFTYICENTNIVNTKIGKFCSVASGVRCGGGFHPSEKFVSTHPIFYSKIGQTNIIVADKNYFQEYEPIEIGDDVWIGTNAIILDGVKIGTGAIIGAGAVVTKDVAPYAIVGGVPAKIIRYRFNDKQIFKLLNEIKWWDKDIEWIKNNFKIMHDISNFKI